MKVFRYCEKQVKYVPHTVKFYSKLFATSAIGVILISLGLCWVLNSYYHEYKMKRFDDQMKLIILKEQNQFNTTAMIFYMKDIKIKFPHIVYAQALLESSEFHSAIFRENNNMFGMKAASSRQSTNKGEQNNHAYYDTWKDCVIDYALYQARYLADIKTEDQYFQYLQQSYAEDTGYVNKLKTIINNKKLKEIFELAQK
jgi:uncharacterized FlgJ-related protein